jgi:hypothetical protein
VEKGELSLPRNSSLWSDWRLTTQTLVYDAGRHDVKPGIDGLTKAVLKKNIHPFEAARLPNMVNHSLEYVVDNENRFRRPCCSFDSAIFQDFSKTFSGFFTAILKNAWRVKNAHVN